MVDVTNDNDGDMGEASSSHVEERPSLPGIHLLRMRSPEAPVEVYISSEDEDSSLSGSEDEEDEEEEPDDEEEDDLFGNALILAFDDPVRFFFSPISLTM